MDRRMPRSNSARPSCQCWYKDTIHVADESSAQIPPAHEAQAVSARQHGENFNRRLAGCGSRPGRRVISLLAVSIVHGHGTYLNLELDVGPGLEGNAGRACASKSRSRRAGYAWQPPSSPLAVRVMMKSFSTVLSGWHLSLMRRMIPELPHALGRAFVPTRGPRALLV